MTTTPRPATRRITPALVGGSVVLAVAASGCGSNGASGNATSGAPSPAASVKTTPLPSSPSFQGTPAGAAADVTISKCPTDAGKQTATGTVKNQSKAARDYAILIMWMRTNDGKPYGSALTTVKAVAPGSTVKWSVTANVVTKVDTCYKNVFAGTLATAKKK